MGPLIKPTGLEIKFERCKSTGYRSEEVADAQSHHLYPMIFPHPVCLLCIGQEEFSYEWHMRHIPRRNFLKRHTKVHFKDPQCQGEFECRHPSCPEKLDGIRHFVRHALDIHGVCH